MVMKRFFDKLVLSDKTGTDTEEIGELISDIKMDCEALSVHTASALGQSKLIEHKLTKCLTKVENWYKDVEYAFSNGDHSSVHEKLSTRQTFDRQIIFLTNQLATMNELTSSLKEEYTNLCSKLGELELKKEHLLIEKSYSDIVEKVQSTTSRIQEVSGQINRQLAKHKQ